MRKMRGVGQLALRTTDPLRTAEFYESAFGFRRVAGDESGADLELGSFELSFRRAEVDAWAQELGRRGFALAAPPSGDHWEGTRSFRMADPDGRQVAVYYDYPR
jgi:catechol 2,3-dioxygenase-like lactoylglutathione lyase family enzyme